MMVIYQINSACPVHLKTAGDHRRPQKTTENCRRRQATAGDCKKHRVVLKFTENYVLKS